MKERMVFKMKRKLMTSAFTGLLAIGVLLFTPVQANAAESAETAAESTQLNQVMIVQEELEAREQPDTNSAAVEKFAIGTPLLVTEAVDDTWYAIAYQEQTLYVPITSLQPAVESPELEQELQQMEEEGLMIITAVEQYRSDAIRSRIWAGVIILLVVGIFAVGIVGSIKNKKSGTTLEVGKVEKKEDKNVLQMDKTIEMIDLDEE